MKIIPYHVLPNINRATIHNGIRCKVDQESEIQAYHATDVVTSEPLILVRLIRKLNENECSLLEFVLKKESANSLAYVLATILNEQKNETIDFVEEPKSIQHKDIGRISQEQGA